MTYQFKEAKDEIVEVLQGLTDSEDEDIFGTERVIAWAIKKLSSYQGNIALFTLGDSIKSAQPIGDRGSITTEGTVVFIIPGNSEASIDKREEIITIFLEVLDDPDTWTLPGLRVEHARNNLISRKTLNIAPEAQTPKIAVGVKIPLEVTLPNRRLPPEPTPEPEPEP